MPTWLFWFILFDLAVTILVVRMIVKRKVAIGGRVLSTLPSAAAFRAMSAFATEKHDRIGEYLRANWSGAPEQLPGVLGALLDELQRDALARDLPLDRDILKMLVAASLQRHHIGKGREVSEAIAKVA